MSTAACHCHQDTPAGCSIVLARSENRIYVPTQCWGAMSGLDNDIMYSDISEFILIHHSLWTVFAWSLRSISFQKRRSRNFLSGNGPPCQPRDAAPRNGDGAEDYAYILELWASSGFECFVSIPEMAFAALTFSKTVDRRWTEVFSDERTLVRTS